HNSSSTNDAAAPYCPVSVMPKYMPSAYLPTRNSSAVTPAPIHVSRQRTIASGSHLNMAANSSVNTIRLTAMSTAVGVHVETPDGSQREMAPAIARSTVVSTSDTSSRNETAMIMVSESSLLKMKFLMPPCSGSGCTSHALLSDA